MNGSTWSEWPRSHMKLRMMRNGVKRKCFRCFRSVKKMWKEREGIASDSESCEMVYNGKVRKRKWSEFKLLHYCFISFNSAVTRHMACGHGRNWLLVPCHRLTGRLWNIIGRRYYIEYEIFSKWPTWMAEIFGWSLDMLTGRCQNFVHRVTGHTWPNWTVLVPYGS